MLINHRLILQFKCDYLKTKMPKKKVGSVHTAKNGAKYVIDGKTGKARFVKRSTKAGKGGSVAVGGSVSVGGSVKKRRKRRK